MQKIDCGLFVVWINEREVRVHCKENDVDAVVTAIGPGLSVHGEGQQAYLSLGRDYTYCIENRLSKGMPPIVGLAPRRPTGPEPLRD